MGSRMCAALCGGAAKCAESKLGNWFPQILCCLNTIEGVRDLFNELNDTTDPVCLYQDNLSAKFLMEHADSSSDKSKHMKVRYFILKKRLMIPSSIFNIETLRECGLIH